jgi:hypothetical protein
MWLARIEGSVRSLAFALMFAGCAHGIENSLDLVDASNSGAAGSVTARTDGAAGASGSSAGTGSAGAQGSSTGSGGAASVGAGGTGSTGAGATGGVGGSAGTASVDAGADSSTSGGAGGGGGPPESGRDAGDTVADASVEAGCVDPVLCALKAALVHRYSFTGTGTVVTDSVGTAHGTVVNAQLTGNGDLVLAGSTQYVDLPNGIIRQLTNATLEIWVTWDGGEPWQRIFDFGNTTGAESTQGTAATTLYVTPGGDDPTVLFAAFKRANQSNTAETRALSPQPLASGAIVQIAVVLDDANNQMSVYRNGALDASIAWTDSLSLLTDVNNWLGRSQYMEDPNFSGTIHEFRIYDAALSQAAIRASFMGGTDPPFLN